ncbi:zinc finger protein 181-like isoform X3 [Crassostrea angulata]|uniref:zinc finger protein 181-like isoform X3 n=1 Tax=Magallana angulata TaxID=2784310 RepID=UPI0022B17C85|nr:zinc finger protein 181-like isoform X3 [Crassostrea angulata]
MSSREFPLNMAEGRSADNANKNDISCYSDVIKNLLSITTKSQQESKKRYKLVVLRPKHPGDKLMMPRPKHPGDPQQSGSNVATDHNRFSQQVETATPSNIGPLDTSHSYISKKIKTEDDSDWIGLNESPFLCTSTATDKTSIPQMTKTENDLANESFISQNIKTEDIITYSDLTGHNQSTASPALFTPIVSTVIKTENDVAATESIDKDVISDARLTGWNESEVNTSHSANSQMLSGNKCSSTMINTENDFSIFGTSLADQHRIPYFSIEPSLSHVVQNEANLTITDSSLESSHMSLGNAHCQNDSSSRKKIYTSKQFSKDSPSTTIHTVSHCPVSPNPVKSWSDIKGVVDRTSSRKRHIAPQQSAPKETQSSVDVSKEEDEEDNINKFLEMSGKFFKCGVCDKAFAEAEELNRHLRGHSNLHCTGCKSKCSNRKQLEKHQKLCQEFVESLITEACPICLEQTPCKDFGLHCKSHGVQLKEIMFNCDKCSTLFSSSQRHNVCVHLENNKEALQRSLRYHCSVCRENYEEISAFKEHMQAHNIPERASAIAVFTCPICDKLFSNQSLLEKHLKNRCSQKLAKTCRFCGQFYQRNFESPSSIDTNNECIKCRKSLKLEISLRKQIELRKFIVARSAEGVSLEFSFGNLS